MAEETRLVAVTDWAARPVVVAELPIGDSINREWLTAFDALESLEQTGILFVERNFRIIASAMHAGDTTTAIVNITGSIMDWLSALRVFLAHSERRLAGSPYAGPLRDACVRAYDGNFAYRFLYRLRNYAQHYGLPVHTLDQEFSGSEWKIYLDRDGLLQQYDGWSGVGQELLDQPPEIELFPLIVSAMNSLPAIAEVSRHYDVSLAARHIKAYWEVNAYFKTNFPTSEPVAATSAEPWRTGNQVKLRRYPTWASLDAIARRAQQDGEGMAKTTKA